LKNMAWRFNLGKLALYGRLTSTLLVVLHGAGFNASLLVTLILLFLGPPPRLHGVLGFRSPDTRSPHQPPQLPAQLQHLQLLRTLRPVVHPADNGQHSAAQKNGPLSTRFSALRSLNLEAHVERELQLSRTNAIQIIGCGITKTSEGLAPGQQVWTYLAVAQI
jgi:hypothetical protein